MKKMIMMLIAVSAVTIVQASSVSWSSVASADAFKNLSGGALTTGASSETSSLTAYFMLVSSAGSLTAAGGRAEADGFDVAFAVGQTSTSATFAGRLQVPAVRVPGDTPAKTEFFARVFVTIAGKDYFYDTAKWTTTGGAATVQENLSWSGKGGTVASWTAVVPEPTSMALLALGVAAIGLRRKFIK